MLLFHIVIALISLITASLAAYRSTEQKLTITYAAIGGTLVSGVLLTVLESVSVARVCVSGGVYLIAIAALILIARRKLALSP